MQLPLANPYQCPPPPPVNVNNTTGDSTSTVAIRNDVSFWERFWVTENGVISISVRNMTIIACFLLTANLIANLYFVCSWGDLTCSKENFPYPSEVVGMRYWDRLICLTATFYCMGAHQIAIRCFYKKLYGKISHPQNDFLLIVGIVTVVSTPAIAYFDMYDHVEIHSPLSYVFVGSLCAYAVLLTHHLRKHRESFPEASRSEIDRSSFVCTLIIMCLIFLAISHFNDSIYTPFLVWALLFLLINFFSFVIYTNEYYESIHPPTHFHEMGETEWEIHQQLKKQGLPQ